MSELKVFPMGGIGRVTQNMYLYEYENEILIVDCGIGFPDVYMPGVDSLIPDITYLTRQLQFGKKIVGLVFSHGHDDHIAASPYILPQLPPFPLYGSPLTAGFAEQRIADKGIDGKVQVMRDREAVKIGTYFKVTPVAMTHSVPDTKHLIIETPEGIVYHGSDFKLDPDPVDHVLPDYATISALKEKKPLLMLVDCLRVERSEPVQSESAVGPVIRSLMEKTKGKFVVTLMSSHIHRIQQIVEAAVALGRKVVLVGRSVEQNVKVSLNLKKIEIERDVLVDKKYVNDYPEHQICIIIAGSQGQEGSSLVRAVYGEHREIQLNPQDTVVFSADVIPGNEIPFYNAIDELSRNGIEVIYPDILPGIHQSGHASAPEQLELVKMVGAQYVMPIGGTDRHRARFAHVVAGKLGYDKAHTLIPLSGEVLSISAQRGVRVVETVQLNPSVIDGLGVGDVGPVVLSDRLSLAQSGIVVIAIPRQRGELQLNRMSIISRGFVFMKHADEVVEFIKQSAAETISQLGSGTKDDELKRAVERRVARKLYKIIQREPMIVTVLIDTA